MTTSSLRTAVKGRFVEVATAVLDGYGVQVDYGWPGKTMRREAVYLGDTDSNSERPSAMTGEAARKNSFDDFTVHGWIVAAQIGQTCQQAEERAEQFYDLLKNATVDPSVAGPNLYAGGDYDAITGLLWVWLRPGALRPDPTPDGWVATFEFDLDVRTHLR